MKYKIQMVKCGRAAMGMTQHDVAVATGICKTTIARFEMGWSTSYKTVDKILACLKDCSFVETEDGFEMTYKNEA